ncbi:MAG TPA: LemA family protein [Candidatus Limnocylindrales bacterium]
MPLVAAAVFAVVLPLILVAFVLYTTYNAVVAMQQRIDKAWANIEVSLEQRHDELPNLVEAVRDVMAYEQDVLERVTTARSAYSPSEPVARQGAVSAETSSAIRSLFAVVERYPQLRSADNVAALQAEIQRLEGLIADRRELYNDSVYRYNTTIAQIPANMVAGLFGWRPREFFAAEPGAANPPDATLRPGPSPT